MCFGCARWRRFRCLSVLQVEQPNFIQPGPITPWWSVSCPDLSNWVVFTAARWQLTPTLTPQRRCMTFPTRRKSSERINVKNWNVQSSWTSPVRIRFDVLAGFKKKKKVSAAHMSSLSHPGQDPGPGMSRHQDLICVIDPVQKQSFHYRDRLVCMLQ